MTPPYEVLQNSPTNESLNLQPRERTGQNEMCNEYHQTISPESVRRHCLPEIVSGHCPLETPVLKILPKQVFTFPVLYGNMYVVEIGFLEIFSSKYGKNISI